MLERSNNTQSQYKQSGGEFIKRNGHIHGTRERGSKGRVMSNDGRVVGGSGGESRETVARGFWMVYCVNFIPDQRVLSVHVNEV